MCSLSGDLMIEEREKNQKNNLDICKKCQIEKPEVVLAKQFAYCKSCYIAGTIHKFRATLGKYRILHRGKRVLVLYKIGAPSSALLHLIKTEINLTSFKKLEIDPVILFIDEQQGIELNERLNLCNEISKEILSYNFVGYIASLNNYINNISNPLIYTEMSHDLTLDKISNFEVSLEKTFTNLSLKEDALHTCRRLLLIQMAKELNCSVIFTPDVSEDVAINMLSNISLGRGSHLSVDVGILDNRDPIIKISQPMRYFDMEELVFYNELNNLRSVKIKSIQQKTSSINQLLSKFVLDLQDNYPSTIKTIVRTGDKLTCEESKATCRLCKAPIEAQQELSSSEAKDFSHWISTHANDVKEIENYDNLMTKGGLCYGCKNISQVLSDDTINE